MNRDEIRKTRADLAAFDRLPLEAREFLRATPLEVSAVDFENALRQGLTVGQVIRFLENLLIRKTTVESPYQ